MAACARCQVPLTLAGAVCAIWGAVWQHGHLRTAGVRVPLPGRDNAQPCHPALRGAPLSGPVLDKHRKEYMSKMCTPLFIVLQSGMFEDVAGLFFSLVIFCSGSSLHLVSLVCKQLSSSVLLCSRLCLRWGSLMQVGGGEWDSSGLLLSCRLAYSNCSQALTQTEDGFSERICGCEGECVWGGSWNPSCCFSLPAPSEWECAGWGGGSKISLSQGKVDWSPGVKSIRRHCHFYKGWLENRK